MMRETSSEEVKKGRALYRDDNPQLGAAAKTSREPLVSGASLTIPSSDEVSA